MLILASASPRRHELLQLITDNFVVVPAQIQEPPTEDPDPSTFVKQLAYHKAAAVLAQHPKATVIGADTIVSLDGQMLGKPKTKAEAVKMLQALSGRQHQVYTGVCVLAQQLSELFVVETQVEFLPLSNEDIKAYVESGEPMDKAGAYGIQGPGALFIKGIHGDYYNVMGLPVSTLYQVLKNMAQGS